MARDSGPGEIDGCIFTLIEGENIKGRQKNRMDIDCIEIKKK